MKELNRCCGTCIHKVGNACNFPIPPWVVTRVGYNNNVTNDMYSSDEVTSSNFCAIYKLNPISNVVEILSVDCEENIISIKRLYDDIIFKVGDILENESIIVEIVIDSGLLYLYTTKGAIFIKNAKLQEKEQKILFRTHDGIDIKDGDKYYFVGSNAEIKMAYAMNRSKDSYHLYKCIRFHKKENAEIYVIKNGTITITLDELISVFPNNFQTIIKLFKQKLGL